MTILMAIPAPTYRAYAVTQTGLTPWLPYGPFAQRLEITVYGDFVSMFDAFVAGHVDITDWPVQPADLSCTGNPNCFQNNPDFYVTNGVDELGIFEVDINHHASILGVAQQQASNVTGSVSSQMPTDKGIILRQALAHLVDKPDFQNAGFFGGFARYVDIQAAPAQGLQPFGSTQSSQFQGSAAAQAEIDKDLNYVKSISATPADYAGVTHDVSAYNLVADSIGGGSLTWGHAFADHGYSGKLDLEAACDLLVKAGAGTVTPAGSTCHDVVASLPAVGTAHLVAPSTINIVIRTHAPRRAYGQIVADEINYLYGTPSPAGGTVIYGCLGATTLPQYYTITQIYGCVFSTKTKDDWNLYTAAWSLGFTPAHLYVLYHSQFASNACGGKKSDFAENYVFWCDPVFDTAAAAGEFSSTLSSAATNFLNAAVIAHEKVMTIPIYSGAGQKFVALNGWNGLVSVLGNGFQTGYNSELNMRVKAGYVPANPIYSPGGGDPATIRRGFSQDVLKLSPFQAITLWDLEIVGDVFDGLLFTNPLTGGVGPQIADWMTLKHTSAFDSISGLTTQLWTLRNDLKFQDGSPLTADDVVYTILSYRDVPSVNFGFVVASVVSVTALDSHTVQVTLKGQSPFFETNIGGLPIIPMHLWAPLCGNPPSGASVCADPTFDPLLCTNRQGPVANCGSGQPGHGIYVGSGPWACLNGVDNTVGGSCTRTSLGLPSGQEVFSQGKIVLTRNQGFARCCPNVPETSLHKFSWADRNNDGAVNILDIADVALHFGAPDSYWNTGQNPAAPQTIGTDPARVDISEVATVAFYFDHGLVKPFTPSTVVGLDPTIDPFFP